MGKNTGHDDLAKARIKCYRLLTVRSHSEYELKKKLAATGFNHSVVLAVAEELKEQGLLNDELYAENFVSWRSSTKSVGRRYLQQELMAKGIDRYIIEQALKGYNYDQEMHNATALVRKKLRHEPKANWRRLTALLYRRGFSADIISSVYRLLSNEDQGELS